MVLRCAVCLCTDRDANASYLYISTAEGPPGELVHRLYMRKAYNRFVVLTTPISDGGKI